MQKINKYIVFCKCTYYNNQIWEDLRLLVVFWAISLFATYNQYYLQLKQTIRIQIRVLMFFDRQNNQKDKQVAYRRQLLQQIQQRKGSKIKPSRDTEQYAPKQQFGLIKNIQTQQQIRRNKQKEFMVQSRKQMEAEIQRKKREKQQKIRRQLQQEQKIKRENQVLRQRYQIELRKQGKKKQTIQDQPQPDIEKNNRQNELPKRSNANPQQNSQQTQKFRNYPSDSIDNIERIGTSGSQNRFNHNEQYKAHYNQGNLPHYQPSQQPNQYQPRLFAHRIQNEGFNFVPRPRGSYKDSYYKQIMGHKKLLQQETSSISELNTLFARQKYRKKQNIGNQGNLDQLRKLSLFLQQKSSSYQRSSNSNAYNRLNSIGNTYNQSLSPVNLFRKQSSQYLTPSYNKSVESRKPPASHPIQSQPNQQNSHDDKWYKLD